MLDITRNREYLATRYHGSVYLSLNPMNQLVLSVLEVAPYPPGGLNPDRVQIASLKEPSPYTLCFPENWD